MTEEEYRQRLQAAYQIQCHQCRRAAIAHLTAEWRGERMEHRHHGRVE